LIQIVWFIQNQCQRWAASSALIQKQADRPDFLILEKLFNLLLSRHGDFKHGKPPKNKLRTDGEK
jgi:hypothetical protein